MTTRKRVKAVKPVATSIVEWFSAEDAVPECNMRPGSFGCQVLVFPAVHRVGESSYPTVFYGRRVTDEPNFYLHGSVVSPKFWAYLPGPVIPVTISPRGK